MILCLRGASTFASQCLGSACASCTQTDQDCRRSTTNLTPDSANFAPLIVATSVVTLLCVGPPLPQLFVLFLEPDTDEPIYLIHLQVTFYFPIKLWFVIRANLPRVDRWTELGWKRSRTEMEHEFQRVISRDENPLSFLYRGQSSFRSIERRRGYGSDMHCFVQGIAVVGARTGLST